MLKVCLRLHDMYDDKKCHVECKHSNKETYIKAKQIRGSLFCSLLYSLTHYSRFARKVMIWVESIQTTNTLGYTNFRKLLLGVTLIRINSNRKKHWIIRSNENSDIAFLQIFTPENLCFWVLFRTFLWIKSWKFINISSTCHA